MPDDTRPPASAPTATAEAGFDPAEFRHVIGHFMSGVAIITARHDGHDHGMTASAVCSLSLEPPMLLVCMKVGAPTQEAVYASGRFAVNILEEAQGSLAERFATPRPDKFDGVAFHDGPLGMPLLDGALASIECEVVESVRGGTHRVFHGAVRHADVRSGSPLAYYRGRFGRLELAVDDAALGKLRRLVLTRELPLEEPLDAAEIGRRLELPESAVHYGLTRLISERLVERTPSGYVQVPLDVRTSDEAFEAKRVIDDGAIRLAVERASDGALEQLAELAQETAPRGDGACAVEEVERCVAANEAFHERMIGLAENDALLAAYRQLSLSGIMTQAMIRDGADSAQLAREHVEIARALRRRDLPALERLNRSHHERGRAAHRRAIEAAGGRI